MKIDELWLNGLDLIERDKLLMAIKMYFLSHETADYHTIYNIIDEITGITFADEEKHAAWQMRSIYVDNHILWIYECPLCGNIEVKPKEHEYDNYCSNCGVHMDL